MLIARAPRLVVALSLCCAAAACGGGGDTTAPPAPAAVAVVSVTGGGAPLTVGTATQLVAKLTDAAGHTLSGRAVSWTSGASGVAIVSGAGLVSAIAPGTTTVTATSEGVSGSASITVVPVPVASVTVSALKQAFVVGETAQYTVQTLDAQGAVLGGRTATWSSTQAAVASVSTSGLVTALAAGTTTIRATSEGVSSNAITVTVTPVPVASIALSAPRQSFVVGESSVFVAQPKDSQGNALSGRSIAWSSSQASVASVSAAGVVTALAAGLTTITATSESVSASVAVVVTPVPVASVAITAPKVTFAVGDVSQFTASPKDAQGNSLLGRTIAWNSTQPSVATVSASGSVTAVGIGTTSITATSEGITSPATVVSVAVPAVLLEQRVLAQQGLAVALASTVLQSQLYTLVELVLQNGDNSCLAIPGGGALKPLSPATTIPFQIGFYFDAACTRMYMRETVTTFTADDVRHDYHVIANAVYTGPTGTPLGSIAFDEYAENISMANNQLKGIVHGLGTYTSLVGAPSVRLGLNCDLGAGGHNVGVCQGGIAQNFPQLGTAYGSVTTLALDSTNAGVLTLSGTSLLTSGAINALTLTQPTSTTMVVNGGTAHGTTTDTGSAGNFSLFPPTPTGWSVTDTAHDQVFSISVVANTVRNLVATLKRISTGATLASITLDQSGTGTITYSDGTSAPVTSWMLSR